MFSPYDHINHHLDNESTQKNTIVYSNEFGAAANHYESPNEIVERVADEGDPHDISFIPEYTRKMTVYMLGEVVSQLQQLNHRLTSIETVVLAIEKSVWEFEHAPDQPELWQKDTVKTVIGSDDDEPDLRDDENNTPATGAHAGTDTSLSVSLESLRHELSDFRYMNEMNGHFIDWR